MALPLVMFALAFGLYAFYRHRLFDVSLTSPGIQLTLFVLMVASTLPLNYRHFALPARVTLRGLLVMWLALIAWRTLASGLVVEPGSWEWARLVLLPAVAVVVGIGGWWRPGLCVLPIVVGYWQFQQIEVTIGLPILSIVDFFVAIEVPLFLIVLTWVHWAYRTVTSVPLPVERERELPLMFFLLAVSIHLGNYLYAGVGKLVLHEPLTWLLENPTADLMLAAVAQGVAPIALVPALFQSTYDLFSAWPLAVNAWVLGIQLFSIVAFLRRSWLLFALVMYDLLHIGIFVVTGILFWKWIVLNTLLIVGLKGYEYSVSGAQRGVLVAAVAASTLLFNILWLAWFDTKAVNVFEVRAETRAGDTVRVPSNYFASHSFNFASNWHADIPASFYPTNQYGTLTDYGDFVRARSCGAPAEREIADGTFGLDRGVERFIREHHARRLESSRSFDFYPHHVASIPAFFPGFYRISLDEIVAYELVLRARCLSAQDGRVIGGQIAERSVRIAVE